MLPPGEPRTEPVVQPGTEPVVQPGTDPVLRPRAGSLRTLIALAVVGALLVALLASTGFAVLLSVGTGDGSGASPRPASQALASPDSTRVTPATTARGAALARFDEAGLAFEYPAEWRLYRYQMPTSFSTLIAYLATVPVHDPCTRTVTSESTTISCNASSYALEPDTLVVRLESWGFPGFNILDADPGGGARTTVGGLPAIRTVEDRAYSGPIRTITWTLARPGSVDNFYRITAELRGPDLDRLETQVDATVASLRYDPPVVPLPTGTGGDAAMREAAARTLASLAAEYAGYGVFPTEPGTSRQCRVTQEPQGPALLRGLDATCSMDVEATPLQLWKMTLTIAWPATDAHPAGAQVRTTWMAPDGSGVGSSGSGDPLPGW